MDLQTAGTVIKITGRHNDIIRLNIRVNDTQSHAIIRNITPQLYTPNSKIIHETKKRRDTLATVINKTRIWISYVIRGA